MSTYPSDIELILVRCARSYIAKGWAQGQLGAKAYGPAKSRYYSVRTSTSISWDTEGFGTICNPAAEDAERWTIQGALDLAGYLFEVPWFGPTGLSIPFFNIVMAIYKTTPEVNSGYYYGYDSWNNAYGRTQPEVLELFDRAIAHLEQQTSVDKQPQVE